MSVASRAPSLVLLGLVVVAAALLIAGYGAAVGVGVVVGLLLGLAAFLAILAMNPVTRGGASYSFDAASRSSDQSDHDAIQRYHVDWMRVAAVDASGLRRVIAGGTSVDARGARVELVVVELREDGGIATIVTHTRPPVGQVGSFVDVTVSDDVGTTYVGSGQGSGGSNPGTSRHDVRFAPAPPGHATALTIRIDSFVSPFPGPAVRLDGPWEFRIAL